MTKINKIAGLALIGFLFINAQPSMLAKLACEKHTAQGITNSQFCK